MKDIEKREGRGREMVRIGFRSHPLFSSLVCFLTVVLSSLSLLVNEKSSEGRVDPCSQNMDCTSNSLHSITQS